MGSGGFKIAFPQGHAHGIARTRLISPQLTRREAHGIDVLLLWAETLNVTVLKFFHMSIALDGTDLSAHVARQSRVPHRIYISCADALPCVKVRRCSELGARIGNVPGRHLGDCEHVMSRRNTADCPSALDLGRRRHASL